jgi:lipoyl-dependent peroxiredoxin
MNLKLYTATVTATAGAVSSDDGALELAVHEPQQIGGAGGSTNPEQLMAAALGSCLIESLRIALGTVGADVADVSVSVDVTLTDAEGSGYDADYSLRASIPGVDRPEDVLSQAVSICPFLKNLANAEVSLSS